MAFPWTEAENATFDRLLDQGVEDAAHFVREFRTRCGEARTVDALLRRVYQRLELGDVRPSVDRLAQSLWRLRDTLQAGDEWVTAFEGARMMGMRSAREFARFAANNAANIRRRSRGEKRWLYRRVDVEELATRPTPTAPAPAPAPAPAHAVSSRPVVADILAAVNAGTLDVEKAAALLKRLAP